MRTGLDLLISKRSTTRTTSSVGLLVSGRRDEEGEGEMVLLFRDVL